MSAPHWFDTAAEVAGDLDDEIAAYLDDARAGDATEADLRAVEVLAVQTMIALRDASEANEVFEEGAHRMEAGEDLLLAALSVDECRPTPEVRERIDDALAELAAL